MLNKFLFAVIFCLLFSFTYGQGNINNYKYVIVPETYDFLSDNDQYQLNSLTKFLFEKYGFTALMANGNYPEDLEANICLALNADVLKDGGLFKTKLQVELKNCKNEVVFLSEVGESREKSYDKAYNLALRDAFKSIQALNYSYRPVVSSQNKSMESKSNQESMPSADIIQNNSVPAEIEEKQTEPISINAGMLYAQPIKNGFQIVDTEPKKVMVLFNSGLENVFIVQGKDALVYKKDGRWILSEYNNDKRLETTINLKF